LARAGGCIGGEREGAHRERYVVDFERDDKKTAACEFNEAKRANFEVGSRWQTTRAVITGTVNCATMHALSFSTARLPVGGHAQPTRPITGAR
jgi:hypothetical protein